MRYQFGANNLSNQSSKIGSNCVHSLLQVFLERVSVLNKLKASLGESSNLELISLIERLSHRDSCSINDLLCFLLIQDYVLKFVLDFIGATLIIESRGDGVPLANVLNHFHKH